jgi:ribosomal protein S18 acetylase RimI-like enzyme
MSDSIDIRPFQERDLEGIAALHNAGGFGPISGGQALTASDLQTLFTEKGTYLFLVAEDLENKAIVGTLGLFFTSEQRVARPGEVYAGSFFLAPEYRNGFLPSRLFMQALWSLLEDGYTTISATVSPANMVALALYKRIGLYRLQASKPDYDGQIELRGYQPLIMRAIQCLYPADSPEMPHRESPWRFLAPTRALRTNGADSEYWHGLEVVTYEINAEQLHFFFRIDVESAGLVEMQANAVHFRMYPAPEAQVLVGEEGQLICELTSTAPEPRSYGLSLAHTGNEPVLATRIFQPQETWSRQIPFTLEQEGFHLLTGSLQMGQGTQDFRLGVSARQRFSATRVRPLQVLKPEQPARIAVCLVNAASQPLEGTVRALAPTLSHVRVEPERVLLPPGGASELTLLHEGITAGLHSFKLEVQTQSGEQVQTATLIQPVLSEKQTLVYQEGNEYVLESADIRVCLHGDTGYMRIWEKSSTRLALYEAWPDVGPPLPGGLKRSPRRVITRIADAQDVLTLVETRADGGSLQRSLHLLSNGRLEISQTWTPGAGGTESGMKLKTFGECAFRQDTLTVPLLRGWQTQAVVYGAYPYRLHEYEAIPSADLPRQCSEYTENWSAFEEDGLTTGMLWQDATEICSGGHWMPALLFQLDAGQQTYVLPRYAYVVGRGGAHYVAEHWKRFSTGSTLTTRETPMPSPAAQVTQPDQTLALLRELSKQVDTSKQEVRVWRGSPEQGYRIENGTLGLRLAPDQSGGITALTYKGINLLQTAGPRPKPFGDNSIWLGGMHPARIEEQPGLLGTLLCDPDHLISWQVEPIVATPGEQSWQGVALSHEDLCIRYEMQPGKATLRLSATYHNTGSVTRTFSLLFHLFLRAMQRQIPERVYYESHRATSCLVAEPKNRRIYVNNWSIFAPGKDLALALWAEPEMHLEIATYEWPSEGFQHILQLPFNVAPGAVQRAACHLLLTDDLAQLLSAAGFVPANAEQKSVLQKQVSHVLV